MANVVGRRYARRCWKTSLRGAAAIVLLLAATSLAQAQGVKAKSSEAPQSFDIPAGTLVEALDRFGEQSGLQVTYDAALLKGKNTPAVNGNLSASAALARLLQGTGLASGYINAKTVVVKKAEASPPAKATPANTGSRGNAAASDDENIVGMPAVMVKGSRTLNTDIERTRDDPQPYVIFEREKIEQSGATNLDDFLRTRLTMNTAGGNNGQLGDVSGNTSSVNLRGLGQNQTLILIDGRRAAKTSSGFSAGQPDLNGIPLAAIERIEILPTTASAIYGGSATGGVINIIMRRDYSGSEVKFTYDNTFDTDSASRRIDFSTGFNLQGRTNVLLSGSFTESSDLLVRDRDFVSRGRRKLQQNNPSAQEPGGFPVLGQAANIVSSNGTDLVLKDGTPLGASFTSAPLGYGGAASDGGAALLVNAGSYNLGISNSAVFGDGGGSAFSPSPRIKALNGSIRHEFSDNVQAFLEASHSEDISRSPQAGLIYGLVPSSASTNPFLQDITVLAPTTQVNGVNQSKSLYDRWAAGVIFRLPHNWSASLDYTLTEAEVSYRGVPFLGAVFNSAIADGSLDILSDLDGRGVDLSPYVSGFNLIGTPLKTTTRNPALRVSGPIGSLKAGRPQLSFLLERQDSTYGTGLQIVQGGTIAAFFPERTQKIDSAYLEMRVPLLSSQYSFRWAQELELQLAARWDSYESANANYVLYLPPDKPGPAALVRNQVEDVNPLIALRYRPSDSAVLRMSYGTGFIPPEINQLSVPVPQQSIGGYVDPRRGNTGPVAPYQVLQGGNPDLQPENSKSWSAGIIYTPVWLDDFRLSLDYTRIRKENNITSLTPQQILDNETYFSDRVVRGPKRPEDPTDWAGPVTSIDQTYINSASAELEMFDLQADYDLHTAAHGTFSMFAMATWQARYETQLAASLPTMDQVGYVAGYGATIPLKFKANLGVTWTSASNNWTAGWTMRYLDSYYVADPSIPSSAVVIQSQGNGGKVPSQTYHDVFAQYRFGSKDGFKTSGNLLDGLELQVGIRNLFNTKPPYDVSNGFNYYSWLGDPRLSSYYISLKQSF